MRDPQNGSNINDYTETDLDLKRDRFNIGDTTQAEGIISVKLEGEARNTTGGTPILQLELQSGAAVDETNFTVSDLVNFTVFASYVTQDPNTSANWLVADVDAIKAGYQFINGAV